jgi:hypothetical protein
MYVYLYKTICPNKHTYSGSPRGYCVGICIHIHTYIHIYIYHDLNTHTQARLGGAGDFVHTEEDIDFRDSEVCVCVSVCVRVYVCT